MPGGAIRVPKVLRCLCLRCETLSELQPLRLVCHVCRRRRTTASSIHLVMAEVLPGRKRGVATGTSHFQGSPGMAAPRSKGRDVLDHPDLQLGPILPGYRLLAPAGYGKRALRLP